MRPDQEEMQEINAGSIEDKVWWWNNHWGPISEGIMEECGLDRRDYLLYQLALTVAGLRDQMSALVEAYNENARALREEGERNEEFRKWARKVHEEDGDEPWKE